MSVIGDMVATYGGPRKVVSRHLAIGQREDRALVFLLLGSVMIFVSQAPFQARLAHFDDTVPLEARLYWSGLFWIFIVPLAMYPLAAISRFLARAFGVSVSWFGARMALFWALLASTPLLLLQGLAAGLLLTPLVPSALLFVWFLVFIWFWISGLRQAGREAI